MKKKVLGIIMSIIGVLAAAYSGYTWYTVAAGTWIPVNNEGVAVGATRYIIMTVVSVAVMAAGIYFWVSGSKKK